MSAPSHSSPPPSTTPKNIEDPIIPSQQYHVFSVAFPETSVETDRHLYKVNEFLAHHVKEELDAIKLQLTYFARARIEKAFEDDLAYLTASENHLDRRVREVLLRIRGKIIPSEEEVGEALQRAVKDGPEGLRNIRDAFLMYDARNCERLDAEFQTIAGPRITVSAFKERGCYRTLEEAQERAKFLRDNVEPYADIFIGPVGQWTPLTPNRDALGADKEHHADEQLNELLRGQQRQSEMAREHLAQRAREAEEAAQKAKLSHRSRREIQLEKARRELQRRAAAKRDAGDDSRRGRDRDGDGGAAGGGGSFASSSSHAIDLPS